MLSKKAIGKLAVVSLLLGTLLNTAVALVISRYINYDVSATPAAIMLTDPNAYGPPKTPRKLVTASTISGRGFAMIWWGNWSAPGLSRGRWLVNSQPIGMMREEMAVGWARGELNRTASMIGRTGGSAAPLDSGAAVAFGWPALALQARVDTDSANARTAMTHGIAPNLGAAQFDPFGVPNVRAIPIRPVWPAFIVGTLFWTAPSALLAVAIAWILTLFARYRRYSRGACPRCAYDLAFDYSRGCHECGWRRPAKPAADPAPASPPQPS